jgi:hypothetical protein
MDVIEKRWDDVDWIRWDQDRDRRGGALMNNAMNLRVSRNAGNFVSKKILASREGL